MQIIEEDMDEQSNARIIITVSESQKQKFQIQIEELAYSQFGTVGYSLKFSLVQPWFRSMKSITTESTFGNIKIEQKQPLFNFSYNQKYGKYTRGISHPPLVLLLFIYIYIYILGTIHFGHIRTI